MEMLAFITTPGPGELLILGIIALLLFGKRLPEVARSLGKGVNEFKRGLTGTEEPSNRGGYYDSSRSSYREPEQETSRPEPVEERAEITAPKFEPPKMAPVDKTQS